MSFSDNDLAAPSRADDKDSPAFRQGGNSAIG